ncbi:MAG: hypothetical protein ABR549_04965 [Mycobacteriales bacterium]
MTTLIARPVEDRLRTTLAVDAVVVGLSGVLLAATPSSWYGDLPGWLVRLGGILVALAAVEVGLASRWRGQRLRLAGTVTADLAFGWTVLVVVAVEAFGVRGAGLEVLGFSGLATLVFGILETSLVRALR